MILVDAFFVIANCSGIFYAYSQSKSFFNTISCWFLGVFFAGELMQLLEETKVTVKPYQLNLTISFFGLLFCLWFLKSGETKNLDNPSPAWFVKLLDKLAIPMVATFFFVIGRMFAKEQVSGVFAQLPRLASEDNAAWLDVTARLASNQNVRFHQIGGPLVSFMSIVQSFERLFSYLINGHINQLADSINTVVLSYFVVYLLLGIAVREIFRIGNWTVSVYLVFLQIIVWVFMVGVFAKAQTPGHLSLQLTALFFIFGFCIVCGQKYSKNLRLFIGATLISQVSLSWLPLRPIGLIVASSICIITLFRHRSLIISMKSSIIYVLWIVNIVVIYLTYPSVSDLLLKNGRLTDLLGADGGTAVVSNFEASFFVVLALIIFMKHTELKYLQHRFSSITNCLQIIIGYLVCVYFLSVWFEGQKNYGVDKLIYAVWMIFVPFLTVFMLTVFRIRFPDSRLFDLYRALISLILLCGVFGGEMESAVNAVSPSKWTSRWEYDNPPGTINFEDVVRVNNDAFLIEDLPYGCVSKDTSGDFSMNLETYGCTRFLVSLHGQWDFLDTFTRFQLNPSLMNFAKLKAVDSKYLRCSVLTVNVDTKAITGHTTLGTIIEYFDNHIQLLTN